MISPWRLDAAGMRAHPARETCGDAALLLQATGGYTQRANSAVPLFAPLPDADAALAVAQAFYAARELPVTFRLPSFVDDDGFGAALAGAGFRAVSPTRVMVRSVVGLAAAAPCLDVVDDVRGWCELHDSLSGDGNAPASAAAIERLDLLERIGSRRVLTRLAVDGTAVGAAVVVIDGDLAGLYSLVVDVKSRGKGLGAMLVRELLALANARCATSAYLQVAASNPACSLYERLGFVDAYDYTYYVKSDE